MNISAQKVLLKLLFCRTSERIPSVWQFIPVFPRKELVCAAGLKLLLETSSSPAHRSVSVCQSVMWELGLALQVSQIYILNYVQEEITSAFLCQNVCGGGLSSMGRAELI